MAAKSIGDLTFELMRGTVEAAGESLGAFDRLGEDGRSYRLDGKRPSPAAIVTMSLQTSAANAQTRADACKELEGTLTSMTDARNANFLSVRIISARSAIRPCLVGGQAKWRVDTAWQLENTDVS